MAKVTEEVNKTKATDIIDSDAAVSESVFDAWNRFGVSTVKIKEYQMDKI